MGNQIRSTKAISSKPSKSNCGVVTVCTRRHENCCPNIFCASDSLWGFHLVGRKPLTVMVMATLPPTDALILTMIMRCLKRHMSDPIILHHLVLGRSSKKKTQKKQPISRDWVMWHELCTAIQHVN